MPRPHRLLAGALLLLACGDPDDDTAASADDTAATTDAPPDEPPTDAAALAAWLATGKYRQWPAESAPHDSAGPHFGVVRTYVNPPLLASLSAGAVDHPQGSVAVKELHGGGSERQGFSVMIKARADSTAASPGDGWYWYEDYDGSVFGDGFGDATCVGCHQGGDDFVLTPVPLR